MTRDSYRTADYDAPSGTIWVCTACGKSSKNRIEGDPRSWWDASCFMHAVLCEADSIVRDLQGRVTGAKAVVPETDP